MGVRYKMEYTLIEKFYIWLAWKLPKRLVYWCEMRIINNAGNIRNLSAMEALAKWIK